MPFRGHNDVVNPVLPTVQLTGIIPHPYVATGAASRSDSASAPAITTKWYGEGPRHSTTSPRTVNSTRGWYGTITLSPVGDENTPVRTGMGRGKVYPASAARHLLNPLRHLLQPPRRTVRRMKLAPDARVLEIGCGPGWFSPSIAAAVPHGSLTLCDLQPGMLAIAAERTAQFPNVETVAADATDLPFGDASFDAVLLATMLGEVPSPVDCMLEAARVLADGGVLTVCETRRDSDFVRLADLVELAGAVGLRLVERHGPRWEYTARFVHGASAG